MNKSQFFLSLFEERLVTVALTDLGKASLDVHYAHTDIFNFELWDVPASDPIVSENRITTNYVGLFNNLAVIHKKDIRKYNSTKQRISLERSRVEKIFIPDSVWAKLKINKPSDPQKLFLQCLQILFKVHNVRLVGMEDLSKIENLWY